MFFELIIALLLGVTSGIITGLTPGIHINLVSLLVLQFTPLLLPYFSLLSLATFIMSMSIAHTFLDVIPSVFLGAPESDTALGVLPGHRYLLRGNGLMAVKLTTIGSFGALLLGIGFFPVFVYLARLYSLIAPYVKWILLGVVLFMILREKEKVWALLVFLLSGILGWLVFSLPMQDPLFPLLSGLFGIATLLVSLKDENPIPEQQILSTVELDENKAWKALGAGVSSGFITALLPGVSGAIAAVLSLQFFRDLGDHGFMILQGAINTVGMVLSIAALFVLDKARNGSIIALRELAGIMTLPLALGFLVISLIAGGLSVWLTLKLGLVFSRLISKVNYAVLCWSIIAFIAFLAVWLSGWLGLLVLFISSMVGLVPALKKVARTQSMGCLLLPVLLFFFGIR
ncbi:MAG TPA: tripartite tricarboxylate transporter permease [Candidatus Nanoarchaeia archaeon]|nr:tripartite tricarboxylate transporter permease [Candidatus Nanoarchaeia archaeon]